MDRVKSGAVVLSQSSIHAPRSLLHYFRFGDDDVCFWHVLIPGAEAGLDLAYLIHYFLAFYHFAEYAVAQLSVRDDRKPLFLC